MEQRVATTENEFYELYNENYHFKLPFGEWLENEGYQFVSYLQINEQEGNLLHYLIPTKNELLYVCFGENDEIPGTPYEGIEIETKDIKELNISLQNFINEEKNNKGVIKYSSLISRR